MAIDDRVALCRCPVPTSFPIPLAVSNPVGIDLVAWTFCGLSGDGRPEPALLLVLAAPVREAIAALAASGRVAIATHFYDLDIAVTAGGTLTLPERDALCRSVLAAFAPVTVEAFLPVLALLRADIAAWPVPADAPELTALAASGSSFTVTGFAVPNYILILQGETGAACLRVVSARVRPGTDAEMDVETVWGHLGPAPVDRAILLMNGSFVTARLGADHR